MKINTTIFQGVKFLLIGGFATITDLVFFELVMWIIMPNPLIAKSISFLVSVAMKYSGNRYWTFQSHNSRKIHQELLPFFIITMFALAIDLIAFHYATKILGPQFGLSVKLWRQISVLLAALSSAIISFWGYKFLVFRK